MPKYLRPWNVKPGMLMRIGVTPDERCEIKKN